MPGRDAYLDGLLADGSLAVVIPSDDRAEILFQDATTARAEMRRARQFGNERSIGYGDVFHDSAARSPVSRSQDASLAAG